VSLTSENMLALMAFADGELEGDELAKAEALLATEPDAARFVEQIGGLGALVQLGHEDRSAKAIAAFNIADAVMTLTCADTATPAAAAGSVTSLAAAREKRAVREKPAAGTNARGALLKIGGGIAAAMALAASVFLFARQRTEETPMAKGVTPPSVPAAQKAGAAGEPARTATATGTGVEVSTVNSPNNSVSVFYLPSVNELSTSVVVWVEETGEK